MRAAVLALQGAFAEHEHMLDELGVPYFEIREEEDLKRPFDALLLPGGESTVQGKLLKDLHLFPALLDRIRDGLPTLGTCAGMILLAQKIENDEKKYFGTMPVTVRRNAYGRQLGSFHTMGEYKGIGQIPETFIRAPYITEASPETEILSKTDGKITAARYQNQTALAFHPELDQDTRVYEDFFRHI